MHFAIGARLGVGYNLGQAANCCNFFYSLLPNDKEMHMSWYFLKNISRDIVQKVDTL